MCTHIVLFIVNTQYTKNYKPAIEYCLNVLPTRTDSTYVPLNFIQSTSVYFSKQKSYDIFLFCFHKCTSVQTCVYDTQQPLNENNKNVIILINLDCECMYICIFEMNY